MGFIYKDGIKEEDCHNDVLSLIAENTILKSAINEIANISYQKDVIAIANNTLQKIKT